MSDPQAPTPDDIDATDDMGNPLSPLVVALFEQMNRDRAFTTNALLDGYREDAATYAATVRAIRHAVGELLAGPYMPTPRAITDALYPSPDVVDAYRPDSRATGVPRYCGQQLSTYRPQDGTCDLPRHHDGDCSSRAAEVPRYCGKRRITLGPGGTRGPVWTCDRPANHAGGCESFE